MNGRRISIPALAVAVLLCLAPEPARAQSTNEGSVRGHVKDALGALVPGVAITATSDASPIERRVTSDATGYYRLDNLLPGTYTITAELQGFSKFRREGVVVQAGLNLGLDIPMAIGASTEVVNVEADTPMLDTKSSVQSLNISGEFLREIPVSPRRLWADALSLAPGVTSADGGIAGTGGYYFLRGASQLQQVIAIDGADMGSGQGGTASQVNLSTEALADTQITTGGVDAGAPLGFGVIANMVTKSGTNRLRGSAVLAFQDDSWNGNNQPGGTSAVVRSTQPEFSLGGPILKNRLWFFGAYRYQRRYVGLSRTATELARLQALYPEFERFDNPDIAHYGFVKATAQLGPKHQVSAFYQRDRSPSQANQATDAEPFGGQVAGGPGWSVNLTNAWSSTWITRFSASYNRKGFDRSFRPDRPGQPIFQAVTAAQGRLVGNTLLATLSNGNLGLGFTQPYSKTTLTGDATYYRNAKGGSHEVKFGFYFQPTLHAEQNIVLSNGGFKHEAHVLRNPADLAGGTVPYWRQVYENDTFQTINADTSDYAFYVQDNWRPTSRLTINAGLRVDTIRRHDNLFDIETQKSTEIGPRLGANYVLTSDQRNVIYVSLVRQHEAASIGNVGAGSVSGAFTDLYDLDLNGTFETSLLTPASSVRTRNRLFDRDRHQPYINEGIVGYRRQLPGRMSAGVSFSVREYKDAFTSQEVNGIYEGNVFKGFGAADAALNEIFLTTNSALNSKVYTGLDLQVAKQTAAVQLIANYTRQWRHVSGEFQPNDPASFLQPDAFANDKGIGAASGADTNSLSGGSQVAGLAWRDHGFRIAASYKAPWALRASTTYVVQSGVWSGPIVKQLAAADPQYGPPTVPVTSNGVTRNVTNPLATRIRFAFPTRGEGQFTSPTVHYWTLRLGRAFALSGHHLETAVEVYNVMNLGGDYAPLNPGVNQLYSTDYGKSTFRQPPRAVQLFFRYAF